MMDITIQTDYDVGDRVEFEYSYMDEVKCRHCFQVKSRLIKRQITTGVITDISIQGTIGVGWSIQCHIQPDKGFEHKDGYWLAQSELKLIDVKQGKEG